MPKDNEVDEKVVADNAVRDAVAEVTSDPFNGNGYSQWINTKQILPIGTKLVHAATVAELRAEVERLRVQLAGCGVEIELDPPAVDVAKAWQEGYRQGVLDERTSEDNIGIAGFGAKVEPARNNPYALAHQPGVSK